MADPQGMDVMCGAESSGGRGDWQKKLGESMEQWGAPASRELDSVDAPPPVGTVPQASFRKGTAAYEAMQNAAGWMHRDREVASVEKGRHAAVNTDEFRNTAVGKGWKASYVVRQADLDSGRDSSKIVDMSTAKAVSEVTAREKQARRLAKQKKRGWMEDYERSIMPHKHSESESDGDSDSSDKSGKKKKRKKEKKGKHKSKKHKSSKKHRKERETSEEKRARKAREAVRARLVGYLELVPELPEEDLRSAIQSEGMDAPPQGTTSAMMRRVLAAKLSAKLKAHDGVAASSSAGNDGPEENLKPLFSRGGSDT